MGTNYKYVEFPNSKPVKFDFNYWVYRRLDNINVYDSQSRNSEFINYNFNERVYLLRVPETEEWLCLFGTGDKSYGFVYIYDLISGKNEILEKHPSIGKICGPLLEIYCNNKVVKFWQPYSQSKKPYYGLVEYNEVQNEAIISESHYEGPTHYYSYNLITGDVTLKSSDFSNVP